MKKEEFERLLELYLKGRLSPSQKAEMDRWLDTFSTQDKTQLNPDQQAKIWEQIEQETPSTPRATKIWIWAAASIVVAIGAAFFWLNTFSSPDDKLILPDGSLVWLRHGAELHYPDQFSASERQVELKGEALFEIARDTARPFTIQCGLYTARVLGTSFNLKTSTSGIELTVLTGTVELSGGSMEKVLRVKSNEHVVIDSARGLLAQEPTKQEEVRSLTARTQYSMRFEDTPMEEIVQRVEGKFDVAITVSNADLLGCKISADFTDQPLVTTISMICEALDATYSIKDHSVTISGRGCPQ